MKSLGHTIDRIIRALPALESKLSPIRTKWKRFPDKVTDYWKELASVLETNVVNETDRSKVKNILLSGIRHAQPVYTLDEVTPNDNIIGVLPEHLADRIKRHDLSTIKMAKEQVGATMTRDRNLQVKLTRQASKMEIEMKKIWFDVKDYLHLWERDGKYTIKCRGPLLVMVEEQSQNHPNMPYPGENGPNGYFLKLDPNMLRNFFRMLGIEPPPGMLPD